MKAAAKYLMILGILVAAFPISAMADEIVVQSVNNATYQGFLQDGGNYGVHQVLGNNLSGVLESVIISVYSTSSPTVRVSVWSNASAPNDQCTGCTRIFEVTKSVGGSPANVIFATTTPPLLTNGIYYMLYIDNGGSPTAGYNIGGSAADTYGASNCRLGNSGTVCGGITDLYFILNGQTSQDNSTRIVSLDSPTPGQITSSTAVTFQFTYNNRLADGYTIAGFNLVDVTASQSVFGATTSISVSGQSSPQFVKLLTTGHQYRWSAYIQKPNGDRITSQTRTFYVVSTPSFSSSTASVVPLDQITEQNATSTLEQYADQYLNIFAIARNKIPFAYLGLIMPLLSTDNVPATAEFGAVTIDFSVHSQLASSSMIDIGQVEVFSTTSVLALMGPTLHSIFYNLVVGVIYVSAFLTVINMRNQLFV